MKYFLFGGEQCYYASGGMHDFLGVGDSVDSLAQSTESLDLEWWHIVDMSTRSIVAGTIVQACEGGDITLMDGVEVYEN